MPQKKGEKPVNTIESGLQNQNNPLNFRIILINKAGLKTILYELRQWYLFPNDGSFVLEW
jgi:hypothetical protein